MDGSPEPPPSEHPGVKDVGKSCIPGGAYWAPLRSKLDSVDLTGRGGNEGKVVGLKKKRLLGFLWRILSCRICRTPKNKKIHIGGNLSVVFCFSSSSFIRCLIKCYIRPISISRDMRDL